MASYAYGISQVNLDPKKRQFTVTADKKTAKAGDVITFKITASKKGTIETGFPEITARPWKLSSNFTPEDIVGGKTRGIAYFKENGSGTLEAKVEIGISDYFERPDQTTLRFTVIDDTATGISTVLEQTFGLGFKDGPHADVKIISGNDELEKIRKRLKGENRKQLREGKDGKLVRQDPIERVRVREIGRRALPSGTNALPGSTPKALPPAMKALPGAGIKPITPAATPPMLPPAAPSASNNIVPLTKQQRLAEFQQATGRGTGRVLRNPSGLGAVDDVGGAIAKSAPTGALKGVRGVGGPLNAIFAGAEFSARTGAGQNVAQAGLGTAASVGGGIAGAKGGAALGAAIGSIVPGLGTAIGGLLGAAIGGFAGSSLAAGAADTLTGANSPEPVPFKEGGTIIPGMENMPFNVGGMPGVFNEPGNPEVMSIQPLDKIKEGMDSFKDMFGGKPKEYKGLADAIADAMEERGIGDPFGLKGGGKGRTFGNMTSDLAKHTMKGLKEIFGGGGNNNGGGAPSGGGGGAPSGGGDVALSGDAVNQTKQLLRKSEGFRENAYWDVNAYRVGYGTDTVTDAQGNVSSVTASTRVTREDAERDLERRIRTGFMPRVANQIGANWSTMPASAQAALTSVAYNYGSLPASVVTAAKTGNLNAVADAVEALKTHDGGVNANRRIEEAGIIRRSAGQQPAMASAPGAAPAAAAAGTQMSPLFQRSGGGTTGGGFQQVSYSPTGGPSPYGSGASSGAAQPAMQRSGISQASLPPLPPTDTLGGGVQRYGASRDNGARKHAGVDFDISGNQQFYSRIGGVVTGTPFRYGADGWAIDIYNQQMGVYERIAEAQKVLVRPGQTVQPGQAVVQGESGTGVIHYEIRKKPEGGFENSMDPIAFLNGSGSNPTLLAAGPGGGPVGGGGGGETVDPDAPTAADAEAFFGFAGSVQGLDMKSPPQMSAPASSGTSPNQLLQTSAQTTIASNSGAPVIVNAPTTSVSSSDGGGGGGDTTSQQPGSTMSDSGLLAFVANQQLMTLGA